MWFDSDEGGKVSHSGKLCRQNVWVDLNETYPLDVFVAAWFPVTDTVFVRLHRRVL